eukprot:TRINITY_DN4865_c0_g1_i1.p1 TRINITY_DN4865_c0_g1~~TRINITY_DN4865_c0_g1_i1.p1  ORF type:complete len:624 (+),score=161.70 TRINITY_DN4865_c0_g1_i1:111-1982(+)
MESEEGSSVHYSDDEEYRRTPLKSPISPPYHAYDEPSSSSYRDVPTHHFNPMASSSEPSSAPSAVNKGAAMMAKFGWKEGQGLGRDEKGSIAPIAVVEKVDKLGLGYAPEDIGFESKKHQVDLNKFVPHHQEVSLLPANRQLLSLDNAMTIGIPPNLDNYYDFFCEADLVHSLNKTKDRLEKVPLKLYLNARSGANPYESIGKHFFMNRAALKMANLDMLFGFTDIPDDEQFFFADICAGPGGFSEYLLWRKKKQAFGYGFTLKGENDWKFGKFLRETPWKTNFKAIYGVDKTGNIMSTENIRFFANEVIQGTKVGVSLVTGDGGFSVEGDENNQETLSKQLILCQFITALSILKPGGNFVCKLFDVFTPFTVGLLYILSKRFNQFCLIKPYTSRPANSERYVVCLGYLGISEVVNEYLFQVNDTINSLKQDNTGRDVWRVIPDDQYTKQFLEYVKRSNVELCHQQIEALHELFKYIEDRELQPLNQGDVKTRCLTEWNIPLENFRKRGRDNYTNVPNPYQSNAPKYYSEEANYKKRNTTFSESSDEPASTNYNPSAQVEFVPREREQKKRVAKSTTVTRPAEREEKKPKRVNPGKQSTSKSDESFVLTASALKAAALRAVKK